MKSSRQRTRKLFSFAFCFCPFDWTWKDAIRWRQDVRDTKNETVILIHRNNKEYFTTKEWWMRECVIRMQLRFLYQRNAHNSSFLFPCHSSCVEAVIPSLSSYPIIYPLKWDSGEERRDIKLVLHHYHEGMHEMVLVIQQQIALFASYSHLIYSNTFIPYISLCWPRLSIILNIRMSMAVNHTEFDTKNFFLSCRFPFTF